MRIKTRDNFKTHVEEEKANELTYSTAKPFMIQVNEEINLNIFYFNF